MLTVKTGFTAKTHHPYFSTLTPRGLLFARISLIWGNVAAITSILDTRMSYKVKLNI